MNRHLNIRVHGQECTVPQDANQCRSALEVVVEEPASTGMAQFSKRDLFNLPNTLVRDVEPAAELLEGEDRAIEQPEPVSDNIALSLIQRIKNIGNRLRQEIVGCFFRR